MLLKKNGDRFSKRLPSSVELFQILIFFFFLLKKKTLLNRTSFYHVWHANKRVLHFLQDDITFYRFVDDFYDSYEPKL